MSSVRWEVVENRIPELIVSVNAAARAAVKRTADDIANTARQLVPVDTGALQDSIESSSISIGYEAEVTVGEDYAGFVEFGTRKMAAQPYLGPAIDAHEHELPELIMVGFEI